MGSAYSHTSHTNLGRDCIDFVADSNDTVARWGDSLEVCMGNRKKDDNRVQVWEVVYKTGQKKNLRCCFDLNATHHDVDNNSGGGGGGGVESIHFQLADFSTENKTCFELKITRDASGLVGGITDIVGAAPSTSTKVANNKENSAMETTIVSYGCSARRGLFVLQKMKRNLNSQQSYMVTLAHYYVTREVGLSAVATIWCNKNGGGIGVDVKGPFKHPSADLYNVIVMTCRTGLWSPRACSHCYNNRGAQFNRHAVGQVVRYPNYLSNVGEQTNRALINSTGYSDGPFSNSIFLVNLNL